MSTDSVHLIDRGDGILAWPTPKEMDDFVRGYVYTKEVIDAMIRLIRRLKRCPMLLLGPVGAVKGIS